jgi:PAP2 superfamily
LDEEISTMRLTVGFTVALIALAITDQTAAQTNVAREARPDVVVEWNAITMDTVAIRNGVEQVRVAAIVHLAMFEAVNAVAGRFKPYLGTIVAPPGASQEAAAIAAAYGVLRRLIPEHADALAAQRDASLDRLGNHPGKKSGIIVGDAAALAMVTHRIGDGAEPAENHLPSSDDPGEWQLTPGCQPEGGVFLHWRNLTPFGIRRGDQFRSEPPPSLSSHRFAKDYEEVKIVGAADSSERPSDRADVARFFAAVQSQHVWNSVARQIAAKERESLVEDARLFALLNMAMNDALIAVMDTKYHYTFWRPETAIRAGDTDGNPKTEPDVSFIPFIVTPCHPTYPSAHAASSYAARRVLERLVDRDRHLVTLSSPTVPDIVLRYTRLERITRDIDDARVYGGIHFRFDQVAGAIQGWRVGDYVAAHNLRRDRHDHDCR